MFPPQYLYNVIGDLPDGFVARRPHVDDMLELGEVAEEELEEGAVRPGAEERLAEQLLGRLSDGMVAVVERVQVHAEGAFPDDVQTHALEVNSNLDVLYHYFAHNLYLPGGS